MPGMNEEDSENEKEVDPTVYLKCRLCLIENGGVPLSLTLYRRIKYCFDISIKQFEHLPQMICKKCLKNVEDVHGIKKKFNDNQTKLEMGLNLVKVKSETTADVALPESVSIKNNAPEKKEEQVRKEITLEKSYDKYFICIYCNKPLRTRQLIIQHVKTHTALLNRSHQYIKRHCRVTLEKINARMNLTGDPKTVVIRPNNIICDEGHMNYYIKYVPKATTKATVVIDGNDSTAKKSKPDPPENFDTNPRKKQKLNDTHDNSQEN